MNAPLVSVCLITYNHENFIRQAIEGVLMQKVDFDWELIIADDCSTDKTRDIILEYKNKYLDFIKLIFQEKNVGAAQNWMDLLSAPKSKYIAYFEGDDYWTDPLKLQKQVDFLEENLEYVIHSGNAIQVCTDLKKNGKPILNEEKAYAFELEDFLSNNNIITCTVVFRNIKLQFPANIQKITFGDWFLYVILMKNTRQKAYRSSELYAVYRVHSGGVMSNLSLLNNYNAHILQITTINSYLGNKVFQSKELQALNTYFLQKYRLILKDKLYLEALETFIANFKYCGFNMPFRKYLGTLKQNLIKK